MEHEILTINAFVAQGAYRFASEGNVLVFNVGSTWRFKKIEIDAWIKRKIRWEYRGN